MKRYSQSENIGSCLLWVASPNKTNLRKSRKAKNMFFKENILIEKCSRLLFTCLLQWRYVFSRGIFIYLIVFQLACKLFTYNKKYCCFYIEQKIMLKYMNGHLINTCTFSWKIENSLLLPRSTMICMFQVSFRTSPCSNLSVDTKNPSKQSLPPDLRLTSLRTFERRRRLRRVHAVLSKDLVRTRHHLLVIITDDVNSVREHLLVVSSLREFPGWKRQRLLASLLETKTRQKFRFFWRHTSHGRVAIRSWLYPSFKNKKQQKRVTRKRQNIWKFYIYRS